MLTSAALLVGLGYWTYHAVAGSLRELRAASMRNLLDSGAHALRIWIDEEVGDAERVAREPHVRAAVAALAAVAARPGHHLAELCAGEARRTVEQALRPLLRGVGDATFNLTDRSGRLIATRFPEYCGLQVNAERFLPLLAPVFAGESRFLRPVRDADRVVAPVRLRGGTSFAWIATPVQGADGQVIASLGVAEPADGVFAAILQAARPGESGEAYAFDEKGAILSGASADGTTRLPVLRHGGERDGLILEPYLNHRGIATIGAWRWLPEYDMGVAIEIAAAEAYAPLRYLNIAFGVVFAALVIAVAAALAAGLSVLRLRMQMGATRRLGVYTLEERIGEGGMAVIYRARHSLLKRPCAVKLLKPSRASEELIERFKREVQLASQLAHPNTVEIFDYGRTAEGQFYYAMEYLDGINAAELVARGGAVPVARAVHLLHQLCEGLAEAHARGLVHRDIKPENIMICRRGGKYDVVKILDFGLVKSVTEQYSRDLTRALRILGTPLYMAPERLRDPSNVDVRADIYSVGAVAFFLLTGRKLFEASDDLALTTRVLNDEPPRVAQAASQPVPLELDLLVQACLEKARENRPQRVADLVEALEALSQEHRWTQREAESWWHALPPETKAAVPGSKQ